MGTSSNLWEVCHLSVTRKPYSNALFTLLFWGGSLSAAATLAQVDPVAHGATLARACASCHGAAGQGGSAIPSLAGHDADWLRARMQALAAGSDPEATLMPVLLSPLSEEEITALAAYFATLERSQQ